MCVIKKKNAEVCSLPIPTFFMFLASCGILYYKHFPLYIPYYITAGGTFASGFLISACKCPHDNGVQEMIRTLGIMHYGITGGTIYSYNNMLSSLILSSRGVLPYKTDVGVRPQFSMYGAFGEL